MNLLTTNSGTSRINFWSKVMLCEHKNLSPNYYKDISCETPYCTGYEVHCADCGVYISKCGCGFNNSMSGWPTLRWKAHYIRCKKDTNNENHNDNNKTV
jgi:hypothetical protein